MRRTVKLQLTAAEAFLDEEEDGQNTPPAMDTLTCTSESGLGTMAEESGKVVTSLAKTARDRFKQLVSEVPGLITCTTVTAQDDSLPSLSSMLALIEFELSDTSLPHAATVKLLGHRMLRLETCGTELPAAGVVLKGPKLDPRARQRPRSRPSQPVPIFQPNLHNVCWCV